jgi:hypothetical protein
MSLYIDGTLDVSEAASGCINVNSFSIHIGTDSTPGRQSWFGSIDDVRIYNRALSAIEIAELRRQHE